MSISEFEIIERYFKNKSDSNNNIITGIGDDAAILSLPEGQNLAVSTDTLVDGVHFLRGTAAYDIGYKSLSVNLSDMAAMAAKPLWATLSLTIPDNNEEWLSGFSKGFFDIANKFNVALVGGDVTHGPLSITVQIMGSIPEGMALGRKGAMVGDAVYITGELGLASIALAILTGELSDYTKPHEKCLTRLNRPEPRVDIGLSLRGIASAAIDISDGLAADLGHLLRASSVGAEINVGKIPFFNEHAIDHDLMMSFSLSRGDDYELCFTANENFKEEIEKIAKRLGCKITCIGLITSDKKTIWHTSKSQININTSGYQHFCRLEE